MGLRLRHLPYVQRRGEVFRYRRPVPPNLKAAVGKSEILISLQTRDPSEAELRFLQVHLETETWLRSLAGKPTTEAKLFTPKPSPMESKGVYDSVNQPECQDKSTSTLSISECLQVYLKDKQPEFSNYHGRDRQIRLNEKSRVIRYLIESLGEDRDISSLTKQDARSYRDHLLSKGLKSGSVQKNIKICAAIVQVGIDEMNSNISNPFHRLRTASDVSARDARFPLDMFDLKALLQGAVNDELALIRQLLVFTGARLNEIAGLEWSDIALPSRSRPIGYLDIRTNGIRRLKTTSSVRKVPLLPEAVPLIVAHQKAAGGHPGGERPVFPRYGRPGGGDAASAALMKSLRASGITDPRKSIHSIRHTVKQQLRDAGCPKDVRDAIQGHSANSISENYGLGHSLEAMLGWMTKAGISI